MIRFVQINPPHRIAARLWTSGWDMWTPIRSLVDHVYGSKKRSSYTDNADLVRVEMPLSQVNFTGFALPTAVHI
jgi:hypothetical protein